MWTPSCGPPPVARAVALWLIFPHFLLDLSDLAQGQLGHLGVLAKDMRMHFTHGFLVQLVRLVQLLLELLQRMLVHFLSQGAYLILINHRQCILLKN